MIIQTKRTQTCQLLFDDESISLTLFFLIGHTNGWTSRQTDIKAQSNMPSQFFQSWGHKSGKKGKKVNFKDNNVTILHFSRTIQVID